jgi:chemotaxis protein histidine kinase CheA
MDARSRIQRKKTPDSEQDTSFRAPTLEHQTGHSGELEKSPNGQVLSGNPQHLEDKTRQTMEAHFGHDFSQVRVHTDERAAQSAQTLRAQAYTMGNDVVFGRDQYAPDSDVGQQLIAHELTHVVQQAHSPAPAHPMTKIIVPDHAPDPLEQQADMMASRLPHHTPLSPDTTSSTSPSVTPSLAFNAVSSAEAANPEQASEETAGAMDETSRSVLPMTPNMITAASSPIGIQRKGMPGAPDDNEEAIRQFLQPLIDQAQARTQEETELAERPLNLDIAQFLDIRTVEDIQQLSQEPATDMPFVGDAAAGEAVQEPDQAEKQEEENTDAQATEETTPVEDEAQEGEAQEDEAPVDKEEPSGRSFSQPGDQDLPPAQGDATRDKPTPEVSSAEDEQAATTRESAAEDEQEGEQEKIPTPVFEAPRKAIEQRTRNIEEELHPGQELRDATAAEQEELRALATAPIAEQQAAADDRLLDNLPELQELQEAAAMPTMAALDDEGAQQNAPLFAMRDEAANRVEQASAGLDETRATASELASADVGFESITLDELLPLAQESGIDLAEDEATEPLSPEEQEQAQEELLATLEEQRNTADAMVNDFTAEIPQRAESITEIGETIPERIEPTASAATESIAAAIEEQSSTLTAHIEQVRAEAESQAQATRDQITQGYETAIAAIKEETEKARQELENEYTGALDTLTEKEATQIEQIETLYADADTAYRDAGSQIASEALDIGQSMAADYLAGKSGDELEDKRCEARAQAAHDVSQAYSEEYINEANAQADEAQKGKPKDIEGVKETIRQSREAVESQYTALLNSLDTSEQQTLQQAAETLDGLLQGVDETLQSTLQQLSQEETAQLQMLRDMGEQKTLAIDETTRSSVAALQESVNQAAAGLLASMDSFAPSFEGMKAPNPDALGEALAGARDQIDGNVADTQAQIEEGIAASEQGIDQTAQESIDELTTSGQSAMESVSEIGNNLNETLTAMTDGAADTFTQLEESHTNTVTQTVDDAKQGFQQLLDGVDAAFEEFNTTFKQGVQESIQSFGDALTASLDDMRAEISAKAEEAANQVQPAWKTWLTIALVIVVSIALTIALGPLVVAGAGFIAGLLGGGAVAGVIGTVIAGAIAGAVVGMTGQVIQNAMYGDSLTKDLGKAALAGAIGGAFGAGAGLAGNALASGVKSGASKVAVSAGMEMVGDVVGEITANLATGEPITMQSLMMSAAISLGGSGVSDALSGNKQFKSVINKAGNKVGIDDLGGSYGKMMNDGWTKGESAGTQMRNKAGDFLDSFSSPRSPVGDVGLSDIDMSPTGMKPDAFDAEAPTSAKPDMEAEAPASAKPDMEAEAPASAKPDMEAETSAPSNRTTHENEPEVEPGVVAKEATSDGHEIKVLKNGEVAVCSRCGYMRDRYKTELDRNPQLREELSEINAIPNRQGQEKASRAKALEDKLRAERLPGANEPISPELYEHLRKETPTADVRDTINDVPGPKRDPVYGYEVDTLEADHIVSMQRITEMEGFNQLSWDDQLAVLNNPENFMGLGKSTNSSKGAKSWLEWEGHPKKGPVPEDFRREMIEKEAELEVMLQDQIKSR